MKGIIKQSVVLVGFLLLVIMEKSYAYSDTSDISTGPATQENSSNIINSPYLSPQSPGYGGVVEVPPPPPAPQLPTQPNSQTTFQSKTGVIYDINTLKPVKTLFPSGCEVKGFVSQDKNILLADGFPPFYQAVFLLVNLTAYPIVINHTDVFQDKLGPGWFSKLESAHWSAVAVDQADFSFNCLSLQPMNLAYVPCDKVLKICSFPAAEASSGTAGTYWVEQNSDTLNDLLASIVGHGFKLPPQPQVQTTATTPPPTPAAQSNTQYQAYQPPKPEQQTPPAEETPNPTPVFPALRPQFSQ